MPVLVSRASVPSSPIGSAALRSRAERMLRALDLSEAELSILLCDDATIHRLNREHRRKDKPTDVLAFALREGPALEGAEQMLGDIVISIDTAARQAREHRRTLWAEVTMLLAHGLLHLIGYDHRTREEERRMNARADVLISAATARAPRVTHSRVDKGARRIARRPTKGRPPARRSR